MPAPAPPRPEQPLRVQGAAGAALTGFLWPAESATGTPPLVFSPGNGFPVQAYRPALAALPPDVTLHALNPQGHGGSTTPERIENWDGLLADLRAYVETCAGPPAILVGHSMGAMLSLRLAAEAPALVAGLLLLEPPLRLERGQALPPEEVGPRRAFIDRARNRRDTWESRAAAAEWFAGSVVYRLWDAGARAAFVEHALVEQPGGAVRLATPPWLEADLYETVPQQELYEWAGAARCPAVLYRGLDSVAASVAAFETLADALPVATVWPVPGTHTFPMEHPAETARALAAGLRLLHGETGLAATAAATGRTGE